MRSNSFATETSIADAQIDGWRDSQEGRYRNTFPVGSDFYRAYELAWNAEASRRAVMCEAEHRQALAAVTSDLEREAASKAVASGRISEEREAMDARDPQPKAVSLFDCLMHFFCRNPAKGRA